MREQVIILFFIIAALFFTLFLYFWKAKKEIEYKRDERWQLIQLKANRTANLSHYLLILFVAVANTVLMYSDVQITLTLNRLFTYIIIFFGLRNAIEMFALKYYDKQL